MQRWHQNWRSLLLLGATFVFAWGMSGCTDDLYASCELEKGKRCEAQAEGDEAISCVEEQNLQCDTKICARFQGSQPYCTTTCEVDGDCVGGVCRQFPFGSTTKYCVEETDA